MQPLTSCLVAVVVALLLYSTILPRLASALPTGPPCEAIYSMKPNHGTESQDSSTFPYMVNVFDQEDPTATQASIYSTCRTYIVNITGPAFKGFMIQARPIGFEDHRLGDWIEDDSWATQGVKYMVCAATKLTDIAIHSNSHVKDEVLLKWKPAVYKGDIQMLLTIVYNKTYFWSKQTVVRLSPSNEPCQTTTTVVIPTTTAIISNELLQQNIDQLSSVNDSFSLPIPDELELLNISSNDITVPNLPRYNPITTTDNNSSSIDTTSTASTSPSTSSAAVNSQNTSNNNNNAFVFTFNQTSTTAKQNSTETDQLISSSTTTTVYNFSQENSTAGGDQLGNTAHQLHIELEDTTSWQNASRSATDSKTTTQPIENQGEKKTTFALPIEEQHGLGDDVREIQANRIHQQRQPKPRPQQPEKETTLPPPPPLLANQTHSSTATSITIEASGTSTITTPAAPASTSHTTSSTATTPRYLTPPQSTAHPISTTKSSSTSTHTTKPTAASTTMSTAAVHTTTKRVFTSTTSHQTPNEPSDEHDIQLSLPCDQRTEKWPQCPDWKQYCKEIWAKQACPKTCC